MAAIESKVVLTEEKRKLVQVNVNQALYIHNSMEQLPLNDEIYSMRDDTNADEDNWKKTIGKYLFKGFKYIMASLSVLAVFVILYTFMNMTFEPMHYNENDTKNLAIINISTSTRMVNETFNLKNEPFDLKNETFNLKNETFNIKNETFNLKNETFNLNNETLKLTNQTIKKSTKWFEFKKKSINGSYTINMTLSIHECNNGQDAHDGEDYCKNEETNVDIKKCRSDGINDDNACMYKELINKYANNSEMIKKIDEVFILEQVHYLKLESDGYENTMDLIKTIFIEALRWLAIIAGVAAMIYILFILWNMAFSPRQFMNPRVNDVWSTTFDH